MERRLIYWRCAYVFFKSSLSVNQDARHILVTNDTQAALVDGEDIRQHIQRLGAEICVLPFDDFKPTAFQSTIFRNNFYKLAAMKYMANAYEGNICLFDSDVIFLSPWPQATTGISLYKAFLRPDTQREPTGISSIELASMYRLLDKGFEIERADWCGGEFIEGDHISLRLFMGRALELFGQWQGLFDSSLHRFSNGSSIFDNDEFLLSRVASEFSHRFTEHLCRVWTNESGKGDFEAMKYAALHLPNEKLTGFAGLFDYFVFEGRPVERNILLSWCGIPRRDFVYVPRNKSLRAKRLLIRSAKRILPRSVYNAIRYCFGRPPI